MAQYPQGIFQSLQYLLKKVKLLLFVTNYKNLPEYANNAAALADGLVAGRLYRTVDTVKVVH